MDGLCPARLVCARRVARAEIHWHSTTRNELDPNVRNKTAGRLKIYLAILFLLVFFTLYGLLFRRLRNRRIGSAAIGSFYDMLEQDRQKAVEVLVEQKAEEQAPEDAEGNPPRRATRIDPAVASRHD